MSEAKRKWQLSVADLAELVRMVEMERTRYPEDSQEPRAMTLDNLRKKLLFELLNPR